MNVKELRIGNLVLVRQLFLGDLTGNLIEGEVISIGKTGIRVKSGEIVSDVKLENVLPIYIDEKWILKFGFIKRESEGFVKRENKYQYLLEGQILMQVFVPGCYAFVAWTGATSDQGYLFRNNFQALRCVHQLQNLYFALTGKELFVYDRVTLKDNGQIG